MNRCLQFCKFRHIPKYIRDCTREFISKHPTALMQNWNHSSTGLNDKNNEKHIHKVVHAYTVSKRVRSPNSTGNSPERPVTSIHLAKYRLIIIKFPKSRLYAIQKCFMMLDDNLQASKRTQTTKLFWERTW